MNLPGYDAWKTETPEDEAYRKMGRVACECCLERRASGSYEFGGVWKGVVEYLCEDCAQEREAEASKPVCADCEDAIGTEFAEDLTGYSGKSGEWLCAKCAEARCDYPEPDRAWPQARNE
ncbi:MAG TPA: hypothetical protein VGG86_20880 [Roseiarcus sp.]